MNIVFLTDDHPRNHPSDRMHSDKSTVQWLCYKCGPECLEWGKIDLLIVDWAVSSDVLRDPRWMATIGAMCTQYIVM